mmetsp:Transcript_23621/g.55027  ORF Transcript_23621/g.55027 Transcript_23621/m.55027 type:complete len:914 (+) Transcript_23621:106-2847(+)
MKLALGVVVVLLLQCGVSAVLSHSRDRKGGLLQPSDLPRHHNTSESSPSKATLLRQRHRDDLDRRAAALPLGEALSVLRNKGGVQQELLAFVEDALKYSGVGSLRNESQTAGDSSPMPRHLRHHHRGLFAATQLSKKTVKLGDAELMLSDMIAESNLKLDSERERCINFHGEQSQQMEECHETIIASNAKAAQGRAKSMKASSNLAFIDESQPKLEDQLKQHNKQCKDDIAALKQQLAVVKSDLSVMERVLKMSQCSATGDSQALLIQSLPCCQHPDHSVSACLPLGQLKSETARSLTSGFFPVVSGALTSGQAVADEHRALSFVQDAIERSSTQSGQYFVLEDAWKFPAGTTPSVAVSPAGKCSLSGSPSCPSIRSKFISLQGGLLQKRTDLEQELHETRVECKKRKESLLAQIAALVDWRAEEAAALAKATQEINEAESALRLAQKRSVVLEKEFQAQLRGCTVLLGEEISYELVNDAGECTNHLHAYDSEICGLMKIRMWLARLGGQEVYSSDVVDCEVSGWEAGTCSKSCGGGTLTKTRTILMAPNSVGAACPPLQIEEACNNEPCPVDCELEDWEGWSACSASCGTGVMERQRYVRVHASFGGNSCGETTQAENCNVQGCDQDCVLGDWCEWSQCDKVCGSGVQTRKRHVKQPATGEGLCPSEDAEPDRIMFKPCNTLPCGELFALNASRPVLSCGSKVDVMLLLDGSGSVQQDAWEASLIATKAFANAMEGGSDSVEMALLLFGGPSDVHKLDICMGATPAPSGWDEMQECNIQWVSHFTADTAAIAAAVDSVSLPAGGALTAKALDFAAAEISNGRDDTEVVVVVVAHARPDDAARAKEAADAIKKAGGRLIWVLAGADAIAARNEVTQWVSAPAQENIIEISNATALSEPAVLNAMISGFCTSLS